MRLAPHHKVRGFAEKVYGALRAVPRGKVTTYAKLARRIGAPRAARAVGNALNKNPHPATSLRASAPMVPCHRVVRSDGRLGGYAGGPKKKTAILTREGVRVVRGRIDLTRFGVNWK
jgi:methylated-DNA-[protein]-cysteine S-methyltransferase